MVSTLGVLLMNLQKSEKVGENLEVNYGE